MEKNWLWAGALGIVAIIVIVIVIFAIRGGYQAPQAPITEVSPTPQTVTNSIAALNQPAGRVATASAVTLKEAGYVVIHEETEGKPAKVIGNSSLLQPGSYTDVIVNLTRASKEGENLYAMLHSDDGDGTYGFPDEDFPIKDEQGNIVIAKFTVGGATQVREVTITYSSAGFSPSSANVPSGGKVTWVNNSANQLQVGSTPHPIHTDNQEVSGGKYTLDISPGQSQSVTVTRKGTWGYHNHLTPADRGTLVVF